MITIELGNIGSEEQANRIVEKLQGKTFLNFRVDYAPMAGNYPVSVSTEIPNYSEEEVKDFLLFVMACEL